MSTLRDLMDKILIRASLEAGVDTNVYADVPVLQIVQSTFDTLFDMWWWPQFYTNADTSFALDGSTGSVTTDISPVLKRFVDLRFVWLGNRRSPLPRMPLRTNPNAIVNPCIAPQSAANKIFQVFPLATNEPLTLAYRTKPDNFAADDDVVDMDEEMMILGGAYDYINSIGLNPGAEDKLQQKYQSRITTLMSELQEMDVAFGDSTNSPPTGWNWY